MRRAQEYLVPNGRAWIAPTHLGFQAAGASIALGRSDYVRENTEWKNLLVDYAYSYLNWRPIAKLLR